MEPRSEGDGSVIILSSSNGSVIVISDDSDSADSGPVTVLEPAAAGPSSPKATTKAAVIARAKELQVEFAARPEHADKRQLLLGCQLVFETSTTRHGCYCSETNTVSINELNLVKGLAFVEETLRHELAHLISPPVWVSAGRKSHWEKHGPAWRAVAGQLGCEYVGRRRPSSPVREARERRAKYYITCGCPAPPAGRNKWFVSTDIGIKKYRMKNKPIVCSKCRVAFTPFRNKKKT